MATPLMVLLQRGLNYVQQGQCAEAAAHFVLVREHLSPSQVDLIELLDEYLEEYTYYKRIEHTFQEASLHFAAARLELQAQVTTFETALSTIIEEMLASDQRSGLLQGEKKPELSSLSWITSHHLQQPLSEVKQPSLTEKKFPLAPLSITCFGHFEVRRFGKPIALCSNRSGQHILRFLVSQPGHKATKDTLQTMLWPEDETEVASRKLYLAISALRRSLDDEPVSEPGRSYIVCKNRVYSLNSAVTIQTDVDEFLHCYHMGQQRSSEQVAWYERACQLYAGPFLPEDIYADWSFIQRERLKQAYLAMRHVLTDHYLKINCFEDAAQSAYAALIVNRCDEVAHRHLIQVYIAQGRRSEALQQYQHCERLLHEELGVKPLPQTSLPIQASITNKPLANQ